MAIPTSPSPYGLASSKNRKEYLYTKGFQYSLDGVNYIGEYHIEGSLAKTGPVQSPESRELTKYYSDSMLYEYDRARNFPKRVRVEPNQIVWSPLETNYKTGFATRYFVERIAEFDGYPIEIDQEQKDSFGNEEGIDEGVYSLVTLSWKLTGSERDVYKGGQLYIQGIYEYNQAQVILNTRIIPNLESAIKSYTEYAKITLA